jgi:Zn-dependent protease with chaperone function
LSAPLIVVPFAIELTVLITAIAPLAFFDRFESRPRWGITAWLASFLLAFVSATVALGISVWSIFDTWRELETHSQPLWHTIVFSFAPWVILGLAGISMALFAQRLDPVIEMRKADSAIKGLPSTPLMNFHGVDVRLVALPTWFAFTKGNGSSATIFVSSVVVQSLSEAEFEALLWHEAGHARQRHNALKTLVGLIRHIGGPMLASRMLTREVDRLAELAADGFALKHCDSATLAAARRHFS